MYQLMNMLVGMLPDLNLHQRYLTDGFFSGGIQNPSTVWAKQNIDQKEAYRALIAVYYLSCGYCLFVFDRPLLMPHSDYLVACADRLARESSSELDNNAGHILDVFQAMEKTRTLLTSSNQSTLDLLHESMIREVQELQATSMNLPGIPGKAEFAIMNANHLQHGYEAPTSTL
jgi:hypothetical protein